MKKRNPYLTVGLVMTGILTALIVLGFFWTPYDPNAMAAGPKLTGPSLAHLMGTDSFGRDIFSRVLKGAGTTYGIALCTVAVGAVCGTVLGAVTGYFGGIADDVLMRLGDVLTAFPSILLALVVISLLGPGKTGNVIIALGLVFIPSFARMARGTYAGLREERAVAGADHRLQQRCAGGGIHELSLHRRDAAGRLSWLYALGESGHVHERALVRAGNGPDPCVDGVRRGTDRRRTAAPGRR